MPKVQFSELLAVTDAAFLAEQAKLKALKLRETGLRRQLEDLLDQRVSRAEETVGISDAAIVAGADLRWHRWIAGRRATLNKELAQVLAQQARQTEVLRIAFGRDQALQKLVALRQAEAARQITRRQAHDM